MGESLLNESPGRRVPQAQRLRDLLEDAIVEGHYAPGDRLDPEALARQYECSRTPIREALAHLAASGMVKVAPKRGTFVARLSVTELVERFEVMAELEGMCGRLAARRMNAETLSALQRAQAACRQFMLEGDVNGYYYENGEFHRLIYEGSRNAFLAQEARRLHAMLKPYRRLQLHARQRLESSWCEHERIVAALIAGDADTAQRELKAHVLLQGERFNDLVASVRHLDQPQT
ncbi:GntR family transcriptional regulator [Kushneria marisflavi]|uniref:GntR family transcriptional regulator n=1 Tax=Kushneria marisflavi TaxID=157779 RepID=A0A240US61_9GAMM|nr:GntR family transcriptional regulator [Kushneria marisflavi]ART64331.1 GntR family transcriptional regulator [Kushneria marisflavi]RKD76798.1 GntR family transcriptional regulator [Kushneria marisflavi]